ncbi:MAG: hypothetical protein KDA61_06280 [Planctomycetales bacterium]|nr:hypothetical protein [Planctomycetales bacterium]
MSKNAETCNPFDPFGVMKQMRDSGLEQWSNAMSQWVHSDAYAQATGQMLDAWLTTSRPLREAMQTALSHALAQCNMPSRDEVTRLAERLTNIEMRLDDMDAKLDACMQQPRQEPTP